MSKRPAWIKWYGADWRADPRLRMCSFGARGLWIDMISLMQEAEPFGHLIVAGVVPTPKQLAALLGGSESEVKRLLAELEANGVFSRDDTGAIYSRRMVRDKAKADEDRENGKAGGNPRLKGGDDEGGKPEGITQGVNPPDKAQIPETRDQIDDGDEARARDPRREVLEAIGVWDDPRWLGSGGLVTAWMNSGADLDLDILPAIKGVMAKRGKQDPPSSLKYFDRPVMDAFATRTTPASPGKANGTHRPGSGTSNRDRLRAGIAAAFPDVVAARPRADGPQGTDGQTGADLGDLEAAG